MSIDDEETDPTILDEAIRKQVLSGRVDGVLYLSESLLIDRFEHKAGSLALYLEGSRPSKTAAVVSGVASAMDDLAAALPVVMDARCSGMCVNSVNNLPMKLEKKYLYGSEEYRVVDFFLPVFPPFFIFFFTFILATVTFQRERARGTLERLLIAPIPFASIILGYLGGFALFALLQAVIVLAYFVKLLSFPVSVEQIAATALVMVLLLVIALLLGLLASFLARNEFQALQFIPLVILPQLFLADIIWPTEELPHAFRSFSAFLPLTHANRAMRGILIQHQSLGKHWPDLALLCLFGAVLMGLLLSVGYRRAKRSAS